jgi:subtilisin family serine protease
MPKRRSDDPIEPGPRLDAEPDDSGVVRFGPTDRSPGDSPAPSWEPGVVEVQFREGVRPLAVSDDAAGATAEVRSSAGADLSEFNQVLQRYQVLGAEPTFQSTAAQAADAQAEARRSGAEVPNLLSFVTFRFPAEADTVQIAAELNGLSVVERAVPVPGALPPQSPLNEPLVGNSSQVVVDPSTGLENQWYVFRCRANQAWARSSGSGVVVADIDWGYRTSHEDLATRLDMTHAYNSFDGGTNVSHGNFIFHGTGVMGLAGAADNDRGMAGMAFQSILWPIQANSGPGTALGGNEWARAIDWVRTADSGGRRKVIILEVQTGSFGNYEMVPSVNAAIRIAIAAGVVVCVAAGNGNRDAGIDDQGNAIPATGSILVGAAEYHATENRRASFSNFGDEIVVTAPGDGLHDLTCSSAGDDTYRNGFGGTSGATPKVAATAALMLAVNPALTHAQVRTILNETGSAVVTDAAKPVGRFLNSDAALLAADALATGWKLNRAVDSTFAHSLSQNAQAHLTGLGWRAIQQGDPDAVTRAFLLLTDAATSGRQVHVFTDANGRLSSTQLA